MAQLATSSPKLMINILSLSGQDLTGCLSNCSNNGVCGINADSKFVCNCQEYFVGDACQTDTRACSYFPCQNGGICSEVIVLNEPNTFNCSCNASLFYGTRCESKIDLCAGISCSLQGKCFDVINKPVCKCFDNYNGSECEVKSETLKIIESTINVMSNVAISVIVCFFVAVMAIDYFTFIHAALVQLIKAKI